MVFYPATINRFGRFEMMSPEVIAAFQCQSGPSNGEPHSWTYRHRPNGDYLCIKCLVRLSKTELKGLTDNA